MTGGGGAWRTRRRRSLPDHRRRRLPDNGWRCRGPHDGSRHRAWRRNSARRGHGRRRHRRHHTRRRRLPYGGWRCRAGRNIPHDGTGGCRWAHDLRRCCRRHGDAGCSGWRHPPCRTGDGWRWRERRRRVAEHGCLIAAGCQMASLVRRAQVAGPLAMVRSVPATAHACQYPAVCQRPRPARAAGCGLVRRLPVPDVPCPLAPGTPIWAGAGAIWLGAGARTPDGSCVPGGGEAVFGALRAGCPGTGGRTPGAHRPAPANGRARSR